MKKFLFLFLLGIFFIPLKTYAWTPNGYSYTAKCKEYIVDKTDNRQVLDYFYFTFIYPKEDRESWDFAFATSGSNTGFFGFTNDYQFPVSGSNYNLTATDWLLVNAVNGNLSKPTNGLNLNASSNSLVYRYSTVNLGGSVNFNANITQQDILDSYEDYCNVTNVEVDFPFDKNEFYTLLMLVATLILMLFFKWCFPMKGGKKI